MQQPGSGIIPAHIACRWCPSGNVCPWYAVKDKRFSRYSVYIIPLTSGPTNLEILHTNLRWFDGNSYMFPEKESSRPIVNANGIVKTGHFFISDISLAVGISGAQSINSQNSRISLP